MHISVSQSGHIIVHGSRRLAARLWGRDLAVAVEQTVDHLVATHLLAADDADAASALARELAPTTPEDWQVVLAVHRSPEHRAAVAQARCRQLARVGEPTLAHPEIRERQYVYVLSEER